MKQKTLLLGLALVTVFAFSASGIALAASASTPLNFENVNSSESSSLLPGGENASQPEFWKIDEYEDWMVQERAKNQELADSGDISFYAKDDNGAYFCREWTQEDVDDLYAQWKAQLDLMKQGYHFTKTITLPNSGLLAGALNPETWNSRSESSPGSTIITLPDGSTLNLGHFDTSSEAQKAVDDYLKDQVEQGNLTQKEADTILKHGAVE